MVDSWATIGGIARDAAGNVTALQFDPATVPKPDTIGAGTVAKVIKPSS